MGYVFDLPGVFLRMVSELVPIWGLALWAIFVPIAWLLLAWQDARVARQFGLRTRSGWASRSFGGILSCIILGPFMVIALLVTLVRP